MVNWDFFLLCCWILWPSDGFAMGNCALVCSRFCVSATTKQSLAVACFGWTHCLVVIGISVQLIGPPLI